MTLCDKCAHLSRDWRRRFRQNRKSSHEALHTKYLKPLGQWFRWNCGLWHFVDHRTLWLIACLHAVIVLVFIATSIEQVMTAGPTTAAPDWPILTALEHMAEGGYRHLPVVEGGKLVAIVSIRDLGGPLPETIF